MRAAPKHGTIEVILLLLPACFLLPVLARAGNSDFEDAERFFREGRLREAETIFARVPPGDSSYLPAQLRLGTVYYLTGRPQAAEERFREYLRHQESAEVYCLLAGAQFNQEKFEDAVRSAREALRLDRRSARAYTILGMVHTALKHWPEADRAYQEALRLDGKNSDTWFLLGRSYDLRNEFQKAREALERSLQLNPRSVRTHESLALTLDWLGETAAAEQRFRKGLKVNQMESRPSAHIHIAFAGFLLRQNRLEESAQLLRDALLLEPAHAEARYELARVLAAMKRWEEAAREGEAALRTSEQDYRLHFLLARICTALGDHEAAERHARRAAELGDPRS
jgi:Tfp pilus assembly protein PilF